MGLIVRNKSESGDSKPTVGIEPAPATPGSNSGETGRLRQEDAVSTMTRGRGRGRGHWGAGGGEQRRAWARVRSRGWKGGWPRPWDGNQQPLQWACGWCVIRPTAGSQRGTVGVAPMTTHVHGWCTSNGLAHPSSPKPYLAPPPPPRLLLPSCPLHLRPTLPHRLFHASSSPPSPPPRQPTLPHRLAHVELAVRPQRRVRRGVAHPALDVAARVGDCQHAADGPVALERNLRGCVEKPIT